MSVSFSELSASPSPCRLGGETPLPIILRPEICGKFDHSRRLKEHIRDRHSTAINACMKKRCSVEGRMSGKNIISYSNNAYAT
jgi:hypothetical protein